MACIAGASLHFIELQLPLQFIISIIYVKDRYLNRHKYNKCKYILYVLLLFSIYTHTHLIFVYIYILYIHIKFDPISLPDLPAFEANSQSLSAMADSEICLGSFQRNPPQKKQTPKQRWRFWSPWNIALKFFNDCVFVWYHWYFLCFR